MIARETLSAIRFGFGRHPQENAPTKTDHILESVAKAVSTLPRVSETERLDAYTAFRTAQRQAKDGLINPKPREALHAIGGQDMKHAIAAATFGSGFGERLLMFWADHFTVATNGPFLRLTVPDLIDGAIRPHLNGTFTQMLQAVAKHPAMLAYLNQTDSFGPNSRAGRNRGRGLNENYARELLELHSLGVGAAYTQVDVRNAAKVLTGLTLDQEGFRYRPVKSEPGRHPVLGVDYGGRLEDIDMLLDDLARHAATARHLARKLLAHFVGGPVEEDQIDRVAHAYLHNGGSLPAMYAVMLDDDRSWASALRNVKLPFHYVVSGLRATGLTRAAFEDLSLDMMQRGLVRPMRAMGQMPFRPPGPDGWNEAPENWITPPGLAARLVWARAFAERIEPLVDPRAFIEMALADAASPLLRFAVAGAESRVEGIALTLVSPEFNRR